MKTIKDIIFGLIKVGIALYLAWVFVYFLFDQWYERWIVTMMLIFIAILISKLPKDYQDPNDRFYL